MTIKLALAGCGDICYYHFNAIMKINNEINDSSILITTIIDLDIEKANKYRQLCNNVNCKVFTSIEYAIIDGDFDFITLMLPHHLHEKYACLCLSNNKHVILEKPIALTMDSANLIYNTAIKYNRILWITEQAEFWPEILHIKELINNGDIGELITMEAYYHEIINENCNTPFINCFVQTEFSVCHGYDICH